MTRLPNHSEELVDSSRDESLRPEEHGTSKAALSEEEVRVRVTECWCEVLQLEPGSFRSTSTFLELGGYSIVALRLIDALEQRLRVSIEVERVLSELSLEGLLQAVEGRLLEHSGVTSCARNGESEDATQWEEGVL